MVSIDFYLVTFVSVFLVTTKMAVSESGSDDVRVTSSSSTSAPVAPSTTDCFTISRASVCSRRGTDDVRQNDVVTTSRAEYDVTMTSTQPLSKYDVMTTSRSADDDVTSGASCEAATPRKSESDWRFRWAFSRSHSYLNLTLDEYSIVVGGYFVVLDSICDALRWNVTIVSRSQRKTFNIVSRRRNSPIGGATTFWFNLEKSLEAKEIYVAFAGRQQEATKQQEQRGRQPYYCVPSNGFMVDVELLHPCDGSTEASDVSNNTTDDYNDKDDYDEDDDDDRRRSTTSEDGTVEDGTPQKPSAETPSQSIYPSSTDPLSIQPQRTTPFFPSSAETTLISSTESSTQKPQNFKGTFRIRNHEFLPNLGQETTEEFKSLYSKIYPLLNTSYSLTCGSSYRGIQKIAFRSGSIVVDNWFEVTGNFDNETRSKSSTFIVDEFSRNGMDVDPKSFKFEPDSGDQTKNAPAEDNLLLIVVVSTVLGVLILVLVVIASLFIWRKTRRRDPEDEDETERQRAEQETRTRDVISGMPRSQLMWQNMPSLKAGFDDQSLFVYEQPITSPSKVHPSLTRKLPRASSSSFSGSSSSSSSSSPKGFLNYSHSHPASELKRDPRFYIPRPRTMAESSHASCSGISPNGWGNSQHGWGNSHHGGGETSQVWGQLPLDYNSVTHDYFVSGPSTISAEPAGKRNAVRSQSTRPWSRTTKFSQRKSGSAPDAVDFGNVFLPSAPPFQLADVIRCYELPPEEVERSGKTTRRSTSVGCGDGVRRGVELDAGVNNNTVCVKNGQQNGVEGKCRTSRCRSESAAPVTSPTQSPHTSGSITNSQANLLSAIYTKSPKKKRGSQTPDNIHRSTMLTLADDAFYQNINSTSDL